MQEKNARVETKEEGTVENGNIAVIDFKDSLMEKHSKVEKVTIIL